MKMFITVLTVFLLSGQVIGQGMEFFHGSWEEALQEAESKNKLIFVDCYTTWCGPCKRMAASTFPNPDVGDFYNANFINVKIDMEKEMGIRFRQTYPVSAFPTLYYIDPSGNVVLKVKGAKQPEDFLAIGRSALGRYDGSAQYKARYDEGDRSYETVYNYIQALNDQGKSSLKIANAYFAEHEDLTTEDNQAMLMVAMTRVDSKLFAYFTSQIKDLRNRFGADEVAEVIERAAYNTARMGVEYESPELIAEGHEALKQYVPDAADEYEVGMQMEYALRVRDADTYADNARQYIKKYAESETEGLIRVASDVITYFSDNDDCVSVGVKASKQAVMLDRTADNVILLASLLYLDDNQKKSLNVLDNAIADPAFEEDRERLVLMRKQLSA